jgi:hypothetical protein
MASTVFGMRGTGDWATPDERPKSYREMAFKLWPDAPSVLTYIMSKLSTRTVTDPEYKIFEWRLPDMAFTVAGEVADGTTSIVFDAPGSTPAKGLKAGDMLRDETSGEVVRILSDPVSPYTHNHRRSELGFHEHRQSDCRQLRPSLGGFGIRGRLPRADRRVSDAHRRHELHADFQGRGQGHPHREIHEDPSAEALGAAQS